MPQRILTADWLAYENKKIHNNSNPNEFACSETWEAEYLLKLILTAYPRFKDTQVKLAIGFCCTYVGSPHPRNDFVACVMKRLVK